MMAMGFHAKGGKQSLAEALFAAYRFKICCPHCDGSRGKPGYIKDQASKGNAQG